MPSSTTPDLPTPEELGAVWTQLADLEEFGVDPVASRVFRATSFEGEQKVTYDHIGSLLVFADDLARFAERFTTVAEKIRRATLADLEGIRREGRQGSVPVFDEYGDRTEGDDGFLTDRAFDRYFGWTKEKSDA